MTKEHGYLLCLLILPLGAAIVVALLGPRRGNLIRWISFVTSAITLLAALIAAQRFMVLERAVRMSVGPAGAGSRTFFRPEFVPGAPGYHGSTIDSPHRQEDPHATSWDLLKIGNGAVQFYIGLDGLNVWLVVLTAVLMLPSVLISWNHISERVNEFYAWLLALQTGMMGVFLAFDIILFYVFFELTLVPLFFLIGIWGGPERRYAARKFFIYTLTGSLLTLLGVLGIVLACYQQEGELTFSIPRLVALVHKQLDLNPAARAYWQGVQLWVFLALAVGFAVKVPLVPLHTWLPLAHVEAPTAGSVDLAGVLLKIGAYGFMRLCLPLAPDTSLALGLPLVTFLAAVGIVYGALCAYSQNDIKKLVAYSSVSHLGLCMLGMFSLNVVGLSGSLMQMINHGLSTGALFLLIGMLYERYHTRQMSDYGGMAARLPLLASFMVFICLSSAGLPGLNGFVGEVLVLAGIFDHAGSVRTRALLAVVAASGIVLGAWYLFTMLQRVFFGPLKEPEHAGAPVRDLDLRELTIVVPIVVLCLVLGVYPQPILNTSDPDLRVIADIADRARARADRDAETAHEQSAEPVRQAGGGD